MPTMVASSLIRPSMQPRTSRAAATDAVSFRTDLHGVLMPPTHSMFSRPRFSLMVSLSRLGADANLGSVGSFATELRTRVLPQRPTLTRRSDASSSSPLRFVPLTGTTLHTCSLAAKD
eukprot:5767815-Heterocapsa_arctica.AAC.1